MLYFWHETIWDIQTVGVSSVPGLGFVAEGENFPRRSRKSESVIEQCGPVEPNSSEARDEGIESACPMGASESPDAGTEKRSAGEVAEGCRGSRACHRVVDIETDREIGPRAVRSSLHVCGRMEVVAQGVELELPEA
jgi:hypothetical protein